MGYMGEELRTAREGKGLSLLQIEEVTKIRVKYLEALENEDFNVLPGKVYIKGFVKNYAAFLGLNVEPFIEYLNQTAFTQFENEVEPEFIVTNTQPTNQFGLKYVFAAIIVMALGYVFISNSYGEGNYPSAQKENTSSSQSETAARSQGQNAVEDSKNNDKTSSPAGVETGSNLNKASLTEIENSSASSNATAAKPNPTPSSVVLASSPNAKVNIVLRAARQNSWALVKVDGKVKFQGTISLNQQLAFNGNQAIYIKLGNAGAIDVYHNGKLLGALGSNGQISKQTFN